jgi:hypothetical protein
MSEALTPEALERGRAAMQQVAATHARLTNIAIPIYAEKPNGVLYLEASAFLLAVKDAVFLTTASHTLAAYNNSPFWVPAAGKPIGLNANFTHTKIDAAVDVAFARLDERMVSLAKEYRVLTLEDVDVTDWPAPNRIYTFIGYPSSANKANLRDKTLQPTVQPYSSHKPLLLEDYERGGLNPCSAVAVFFDLSRAERESTGEIVQPKSPVGMSGGPVFRIGDFRELFEKTNVEKVVGLGVIPKPDMLIGARISLVIEGIRSRHPDLADVLPENPRCAYNVQFV